MFYQWNRPTAWSITDPMKAYNADGEIVGATWESGVDNGTSWLPANDPSPAGWLFADIAIGNSIFFPAAANRDTTGVLSINVGVIGSYWSASSGTGANNIYMASMQIHESGTSITEGAVWGAYPTNGYTVRCVKVGE